MAKVVAHAGKIVEVRYRVVAKEGELPSAVRKVNVQAPPTSAYRSPYVQGAGVSGTQVYLSKVGTWTDVLMDPWYLMFPEQKVSKYQESCRGAARSRKRCWMGMRSRRLI
ncbi:hypothetical protein OGV25_06420 [Pseudomonas sp. P1B16]|uniref:hypothetical protein n=1 Tax=Pseudomonas sp. P1B16 TaxID=2986074 RepID=UPI002A24D5B5|nr:hypothetical protein [Pseudomonas sp. P1B16]WPM27847.1 hypothetical protein OGV25_06420 [Pseudomonas sp. P1B16]